MSDSFLLLSGLLGIVDDLLATAKMFKKALVILCKDGEVVVWDG